MATCLQKVKKGYLHRIKKRRVPVLSGSPFRKGLITKLTTQTPKKPNSAIRQIVRVAIKKSNKKVKVITAYVPGIGHTLQLYARVLVRGGRVPDLPGVRYHLVRGVLDFLPEELRRQSRSKYGIKKRI
jgi:small subunit ribosomal protein S12